MLRSACCKATTCSLALHTNSHMRPRHKTAKRLPCQLQGSCEWRGKLTAPRLITAAAPHAAALVCLTPLA